MHSRVQGKDRKVDCCLFIEVQEHEMGVAIQGLCSTAHLSKEDSVRAAQGLGPRRRARSTAARAAGGDSDRAERLARGKRMDSCFYHDHRSPDSRSRPRTCPPPVRSRRRRARRSRRCPRASRPPSVVPRAPSSPRRRWVISPPQNPPQSLFRFRVACSFLPYLLKPTFRHCLPLRQLRPPSMLSSMNSSRSRCAHT